MEKLEVKKVTLRADGILEVHTNITDNLELARHVNKDRMEKCLNDHPFEMHLYQMDDSISTIRYMGEVLTFKASEFQEFMKQKFERMHSGISADIKTAEEILEPYLEKPFTHTVIVSKENAIKAMNKFGDQFKKDG